MANIFRYLHHCFRKRITIRNCKFFNHSSCLNCDQTVDKIGSKIAPLDQATKEKIEPIKDAHDNKKLIHVQADPNAPTNANEISETPYLPEIDESDPMKRTITILKHDFSRYFNQKKDDFGLIKKILLTGDPSLEQGKELPEHRKEFWPSRCDILVIGGGAVGSAIAYQIKEMARQGVSLVVVERDSTYKTGSTALSVGGIRQQFSNPENILLSLYGVEFLRHAHELLSVNDFEFPNINFQPHGYLTLASEVGYEQIKENHKLQRSLNAKVQLLSPREIKNRFPWINTEGVSAGVLGLENEGWFDPYSLLIALRRKAQSYGAFYVTGEVTGLLFEEENYSQPETHSKKLRNAKIKLPNGAVQNINFAQCILAGGGWSGQIGRLCGIGTGNGMMSQPIPVEPRKRFVYVVHCPNGPGLDCPLVIDSSGAYFRREGLGNTYLCGRSPSSDEKEPSVENLDVDYEFFESDVWPMIANRVPAFEKLKMQSAWAGYYDYNTFDQNGIVGYHPIVENLMIATGFSGHGIQQAVGVGRAVMEMMLEHEYTTINLEKFSFNRILANDPCFESNIY